MPSIENPTYYDRAEYIAASRADDFLKSLEFPVESTGTVDSPLGWVGLFKVSRDDIRDYVSREGDPWMSMRRNFEAGWYIVRIDSNGLVWGMFYGGWCYDHDDFCADTREEENARADFAEAVEVDSAWRNDPIDVWLRIPDGEEEAEAEANTYMTELGYRVDWSLSSVGLVTSVEFDTLADAYDWLEREGFTNYSS